MDIDAAPAEFIAKWREHWPEWSVAETFVPEEQREVAAAWFALRHELTEAAWGGGDPRPGEATAAAAHRRLREELGFDCPLTERFQFEYKATSAAEGLTEHELDHVFTGVYAGAIRFDPAEVAAVRWVEPAELDRETAAHPEAFTPWFKLALARAREAL